MTIDRIFLGMLSTEALGAAMAVMGVFWVPMALLQQTASYITTFVAQYFGANEKEKIGEAVWQAIIVSVIGGIAFLGLNFLSAPFFSLVGHAPNLQLLETQYFNSIAFSALPTALVAVSSGFFTGIGNTKKVMQINFVGLALNALLDYLLIFGNMGFPAMGIRGAGYATAIATFGAAIYGFYLLLESDKDKVFRILESIKLNSKLMLQFLKFGLPSGMQWALEGLAFTVFLIIMGRLPNGEAALAGSSIAVTVMMLAVLPSMGVAQAVLTLVGQHLGENKPDEAQRSTWSGVRVTLIYILCMSTCFVLFPEFFMQWFKNEENAALWQQVSEITPGILRIVALFVVLDSLYLNISFALKGAGDTRFVSIMALVVPWPIMVLPAYLVKDQPNAVYLAWGFGAVYVLTITTVILLRFLQGKWKTMSVIH